MRSTFIIAICLTGLSACSSPAPPAELPDPATLSGCRTLDHAGASFVLCSYRSDRDIRLFHADAVGEPYRQFDVLARELDEQGKTLVFAMNGGMYHDDRTPVGFYRDEYGDKATININDGPGNFHLKPNGIFWLDDGLAGVTESQAYLDQAIDPDFATQSGPMLVINGELHPDLNPDGTSHKRRNGVGVSADGRQVHFVISDGQVTFHDFATLFRDRLDTPNALFLDGQVSRLYAPSLQRNESGLDLGPIVGVVE